MLPRNLESNSSLEGIFDNSWTPATSYTVPSTTPAFTSNFSDPFANLQIILAGAVASSLEIAIALGPSKYSFNPAKSVPSNALFIIVFLQTL